MQVDPMGKRFCEVAMRQGHLSRDQAISILKKQQELRAAGDKRIAGLVALQMGLMTKDQAKAVVAEIKGYTAAEKPVCASCGMSLEPGSVICMACGYNSDTGEKLSTEMTVEKEPEVYKPPPKWKDPAFMANFAVKFIAVLAIVVILFVVRPWEWFLDDGRPDVVDDSGNELVAFDPDRPIEESFGELLETSPSWKVWQGIRKDPVTWKLASSRRLYEGEMLTSGYRPGSVSISVTADGALKSKSVKLVVNSALPNMVFKMKREGGRINFQEEAFSYAKQGALEAAAISGPLQIIIESNRTTNEVRDLALMLIESKSSDVRARALTLVAKFPAVITEIIPLLEPLLTSKVSGERERAVMCLLALDPNWEKIGPFVKPLIQKSSPAMKDLLTEFIKGQPAEWIETTLLAELQTAEKGPLHKMHQLESMAKVVAIKSDKGLHWYCGLAVLSDRFSRQILMFEKNIKERALRHISEHANPKVRLAIVKLLSGRNQLDELEMAYLKARLDDEDAATALAAARAIGGHGGDTVDADLKILGNDKLEKIERKNALARILKRDLKDPRILEATSPFLYDEDSGYVQGALKVLAAQETVDAKHKKRLIELLPTSHQPLIFECLKADDFSDEDRHLVVILIELGAKSENELTQNTLKSWIHAIGTGAIDGYKEVFEKADRHQVRFAARVLAGYTMPAQDLLQPMADLMVQPRHRDAAPHLAEAVTARGNSSIAVFESVLSEGLKEIKKHSKDTTLAGRQAAIVELKKSRATKAIELLTRSVGDRSKYIRADVLQAAVEETEFGLPIWKALLHSDDKQLVERVLQRLHKLPKPIEVLEKDLATRMLDLKTRRIDLYVAVYEAWDMDLVKPLWKGLRGKDAMIHRRLITILDIAESRPAKGIQVLDKLGKSKDNQIASQAIRALGKYAVKHKTAVSALQRYVKSKDPSIKSLAESELSRLK